MGKFKILYYHLRRFASNLKKAKEKSIVFEFHAADHCNLTCSGCSHYAPLAAPRFPKLSDLDYSLSKLRPYQDICYRVNILGGEPLLNPEISDIIRITRKQMDVSEIHLVTNGILLLQPDKLPEDFWDTCRENNIVINVTQYPIKLDYERIRQKCKENGVRFEIGADRNNGETKSSWYSWPLNERGSRTLSYILKIFKVASCDRSCFNIVGNRLYPCSFIPYICHVNRKFGTNFKIRHGDYIELDKLKSKRQLRKLQMIAVPFCRYCPSCRKWVDWKPTKYEKKEWLTDEKPHLHF